MNDTTKTDRRTWLKLGGSALAGAIGGHVAGSAAAPLSAATQQAANFRWTLEIQGGYGWLFYENGTVLIMALKQSTCSFFDHKMTLIVPKLDVNLDGGSYAPTLDGDYYTWALDSETTFTEGLPGSGVKPGLKTEWKDLKKPFAPARPRVDDQWNDRVWLAEPVAANPSAPSLASRSILVTDGDLTVLPPLNDWGLYCRWKFNFKDGSGTKKKALTDRLRFQKDVSSTRIGLNTKGGTILLKPKCGVLPMAIRYQFALQVMPFNKKQPLPHFGMLYEFSKSGACNNVVVPTIESRDGFSFPKPAGASPGDLCPPLMLFEE